VLFVKRVLLIFSCLSFAVQWGGEMTERHSLPLFAAHQLTAHTQHTISLLLFSLIL
jgi:hypothetical protein